MYSEVNLVSNPAYLVVIHFTSGKTNVVRVPSEEANNEFAAKQIAYRSATNHLLLDMLNTNYSKGSLPSTSPELSDRICNTTVYLDTEAVRNRLMDTPESRAFEAELALEYSTFPADAKTAAWHEAVAA